ncbi:hypothetical protein L9F63_017361, partial [Diploptera punctata]
AEFIQCKKGDANTDKCLVGALKRAIVVMKNGIPSHHILPADPMSISKFVIEESPNKPVSINLEVTDAKFYGISDAEVISVKSDLDNREAKIEIAAKKLKLDGDYVMDGKFLILPMKGKGKLLASIENLKALITIKADPKVKNGETHWDVKLFDLDVYEVSKFTAIFENLFNGDEALAKPVQDSMLENWKDLWDSLRPAIQEVFASVLKRAASEIFEQVPEKDMFL